MALTTVSPTRELAAIPSGDPFVRVFTLLAALRRRWRVWSATALVGLVLGGAFLVLVPPQWSATTTVLLERPSTISADPAVQMATDVQIAASRTVRNAADHRLASGTTYHYSVSSLTDDVLRINTQASTAFAAMESANALASAFLSLRGQQFMQEAQVTIAALAKESDPLTAEETGLNAQINAATQPGASSSAIGGLGDLLTSRAQVDSQLASIQQQSSEATIAASVAVHNSVTLDRAYTKRPPKIRTAAEDVAAGLVGGLVVGAGWVIFAAATTERVRRREDVMAALDAPVAVSVDWIADQHRFRGRPFRVHVRRLRRQHRKAPVDVVLLANQIRRALAASDTAKRALLIVSVDSDWSAAPIVAAVAAELRGEGNKVLMADFSKRRVLARLLRAKGRSTTVQAGPPVSKLWRGANPLDFNAALDEWLHLKDLSDESDIILVLATLDPAVGAVHFDDLATTAVVVVTAGRSTATVLRTTARMIRSEGIHLHSAVLVGADRKDETCGLPPWSASPIIDARALETNS